MITVKYSLHQNKNGNRNCQILFLGNTEKDKAVAFRIWPGGDFPTGGQFKPTLKGYETTVAKWNNTGQSSTFNDAGLVSGLAGLITLPKVKAILSVVCGKTLSQTAGKTYIEYMERVADICDEQFVNWNQILGLGYEVPATSLQALAIKAERERLARLKAENTFLNEEENAAIEALVIEEMTSKIGAFS